MKIEKIRFFERKNELSVNVYGFDEEGINPLRVSPDIKARHVD